jgi:hypothetical protein
MNYNPLTGTADSTWQDSSSEYLLFLLKMAHSTQEMQTFPKSQSQRHSLNIVT